MVIWWCSVFSLHSFRMTRDNKSWVRTKSNSNNRCCVCTISIWGQYFFAFNNLWRVYLIDIYKRRCWWSVLLNIKIILPGRALFLCSALCLQHLTSPLNRAQAWFFLPSAMSYLMLGFRDIIMSRPKPLWTCLWAYVYVLWRHSLICLNCQLKSFKEISKNLSR